jgi:hypothetical protein
MLNEFLRDDDVDNSFLNVELNTSYFSPDEFIQKFSSSNKPLFISTNIQSITSKFNSLNAFISDITLHNVPVAVIVLQESWDIPYPELISIKGYQPIAFKSRVNSRGGGVGFYVKNGINYKIINTGISFIERIFENLTIEIQLNNEKIILGNVYRSPNPPAGVTNTTALENFTTELENYFNSLTNTRKLPLFFLTLTLTCLTKITLPTIICHQH